jgi:hypothetical protein
MITGVCRFCGCSEQDACFVDGPCGPEGCAWTDATRSVCTTCAPAAKAEGIIVRRLARAGYRSEEPGLGGVIDFVDAFHRGFVAGWFGVSTRSPYGRNPYRLRSSVPSHQRTAWDLGHRQGEEASRQYQQVCGPLPNAPRRDVLRVSHRGDRRLGRRVAHRAGR